MSSLDRQRRAVAPASTGFLDRENGKISGVCAGIARRFAIDATVVRIAFVLGTVLGFGSLIIVYIAIALIAD